MNRRMAALSNLNDHGQARVLQSQGHYWKAEVGVPGVQLFLICNTRLAHLQLVSVVGPRHFSRMVGLLPISSMSRGLKSLWLKTKAQETACLLLMTFVLSQNIEIQTES